jgi:RNA polymerase sigma-70 factor (sigma-E family)
VDSGRLEVGVVKEPGSDFDSFVAAAGPWLYKLAYLLTVNTADADDLVQESLTRVFAAWPHVHTVANLDAYTRRVMVNANRRRFRRHRITEILDGLIHDRSKDQNDFAVIDDRHQIASALAALPRRQRLVVVLRYYEDLSENDIAALMNCSVGTVKSQASKAMAKLRDHPSLKVSADPQPDGVPHD